MYGIFSNLFKFSIEKQWRCISTIQMSIYNEITWNRCCVPKNTRNHLPYTILLILLIFQFSYRTFFSKKSKKKNHSITKNLKIIPAITWSNLKSGIFNQFWLVILHWSICLKNAGFHHAAQSIYICDGVEHTLIRSRTGDGNIGQ